MKPLILLSAVLSVGFLYVPDLWYSAAQTTLLLLLVEPPPPTMGFISDIILVLAIVSSVIAIGLILTYRRKEEPVEVLIVNHASAAWLLFITIILDVLSMISFMFTESGMKPHPLAEPDRAAPVLIWDPRTSESLFLLLGIVFASGSMLSLLITQKTRHHKHTLSIVLAILCFLSILLGALHYWLTI